MTPSQPQAAAHEQPTDTKLAWGSGLLALIGALFVASGLSSVYRGLFTDSFEAGVDALGGVTAGELAASNPEMASYIAHLHVNGGTLAALVGLAVIVLVWFGVRRGHRWALATVLGLPVAYLVMLVVMHATASFPYHVLDHLGAVGVGLPLLALGGWLSWQGIRQADPARPGGGPP